ncbi:PilZ domain-containing protein [Colwelliaceae bacterium 6471]
MDKDFSQYKKIISDFRGNVLKPDFEAKYAAATKNLAKTDRFLLKMELKRLAAPCTRLVDLRGHVNGECRPYEHEERVHYLDDLAIKVFEESVASYHGYTFGVYEAVTNTENNFRVIYQKEKANIQIPALKADKKILEKTQYPAKLYQYGRYYNRAEERMNFAVSITVGLNDKSEVQATSSDLSVNGCKFRLNSLEPLKLEQTIFITFTGFEQEFEFGKVNRFEYKIKNIQLITGGQLVGVERVYQEGQESDGFKAFLKGFIRGNKRRYKINLDNTIDAIQARSLEQFILPKSSELPVFIEEQKGNLLPKYALTCNNNQNTYQYWQDEKSLSTLYFLITPERISQLKKLRARNKSLLVYSFIHINQEKNYFYTADEKQLLEDPEFMQSFLGFAASKESFAITELSIIDVEPASAHSPFALSDTLTKSNEYLNMPVPEEVKQTLTELPYIVVVNDLSDERLKQDYAQLNFDKINTTKLKKFGHKRLTNPPVVDEVGINYKNQRQEARFIYTTPSIVEISGLKIKGHSQDFSASGLKIILEKPAVLTKGDIVHLSFPNLQKVTSSFDLKGLPYEIIHINKKKNIINLRVYVEQHQHIGRAFFKLLIDKNKNKLTPDEYTLMSPELAKALRNVYSCSSLIPALMVQTSGSRYKMEVLAASENENGKLIASMGALSDSGQLYNLYPLLNNIQAVTDMSVVLKKMQEDDEPFCNILYIAIDPSVSSIEQSVTTRYESDLATPALKYEFIRDALKKGDFYCLQIKMSRADEPDMEHLNPELSYISSYAIHRGKQIEQDIWSVTGVIQLFDITQEALIRNKFYPSISVTSSTKKENVES